jgi:hypothetical protein
MSCLSIGIVGNSLAAPCERSAGASDCASARKRKRLILSSRLFDIVTRYARASMVQMNGKPWSDRPGISKARNASSLQTANFRGFFCRGLIEAECRA